MAKSSVRRAGIFMAALAFLGTSTAQADVQWSGFGSAYYAQSLEDNVRPSGFSDRYGEFTAFSLLGLNISAKLDDKLSAAAQIVADSTTTNENWTMRAKWAFLTYNVSDSLSVRGGRQLVPSLMESEFTSVGYLLPMRGFSRAMASILPFPAFDGFSLNHNAELGSMRLRSSLYTGTGQVVYPGISISGKNKDLVGLATDLSGDGWNVHASVSRYHSTTAISTTSGVLLQNIDAIVQAYTLGYRFEKFNIVNWAQMYYGENVRKEPTVRESRAQYFFIGYRLGDFMPNYMLENADRNSGPGQLQENISHTFGLNYQLAQNAVVKANYQIGKIADGKTPVFASRTTGSTDQDMSAVYVGVDFIF